MPCDDARSSVDGVRRLVKSLVGSMNLGNRFLGRHVAIQILFKFNF